MTTPHRLVIIGPQGVGKGTQAALLASSLDIEHLSTGELLREAIAQASPLGHRVAAYVERGDLVPDAIILQLVEQSVTRFEAAGRGYVLDGVPRTVDQAVALASLLPAPFTLAIELTLPLDLLLDRLTQRRVCPGCGAATTAPASYVDAVACPLGDGIAVRRPDDAPAAIARRLALYDRNAEPLLAWFRGATEVVTVSSADEPHDVHLHIMSELALRGAASPMVAGLRG